MINPVTSSVGRTGKNHLSPATTTTATAPTMSTPTAGPLPAGFSALTGHARIIALSRSAESGVALFSAGSASGGAIQIFIPPFARGTALCPVKVCFTAALPFSVPLADHVFTSFPVK